MTTILNRHASPASFGLLLLTLGAVSCGTSTGATLGGAAVAGIGAATGSSVGGSAAIGGGEGGTAGAIYDIYGYHRHSGDYDDRYHY